MVFALRLVLILALSSLGSRAQETARFRIWMAGQEVGARDITVAGSDRYVLRDTVRMERLGIPVEQKEIASAVRDAGGVITFAWTVTLSAEPVEGTAVWEPRAPDVLRLRPKNLPERVLAVKAGAILWPGDADARMREAARFRKDVFIRGFSPGLQQFTELNLKVLGPEPLPGFPDTVHFKGQSREGAMTSAVEMWISPTAGEVKDFSYSGGIDVLVQRAELPAPSASARSGNSFERTLKTLPPHPFLPWIPRATLRWKGPGDPRLPEDDQQKRLGPGLLRLTRPKAPSPLEAAEPPVTGKPLPTDEPYLAATPLVQFQDPAFDGVMARLRPPAGASRWDLAQRVNRFVFDWITEKDYTVGFATALEVVRTPRGDCTEHGVLAVALLRKLGVPSRGAVGWLDLGGTLGMHFWVEVELRGRWVPIDPTFDEAPASALHLKLATTDLADLGSIGWDTASSHFAEGDWIPDGDWLEGIRITGDRVVSPDGTGLRLPGATWALKQGILTVHRSGAHQVEAVPHPAAAALSASKPLQSARSGLRGWWSGALRTLWVEGPESRWLQVQDLEESQAVELLEALEFGPARAKEAQ
jgi:transglutaminase-like putative cysteine protease